MRASATARGHLDDEEVESRFDTTVIDPSLSVGEVAFDVMRRNFEAFVAREPATRLGEDPKAELEEVVASGDRVMVVVRTPGVDSFRERKGDDRNYAVFTVREGRIVALRDCRDRQEAVAAAAIESRAGLAVAAFRMEPAAWPHPPAESCPARFAVCDGSTGSIDEKGAMSMEGHEFLEHYESTGEEGYFLEAKPLYEQALAVSSDPQLLLQYGYLLESRTEHDPAGGGAVRAGDRA